MSKRHRVQLFTVPRSGSTYVRGILNELTGGDVPPQLTSEHMISCEFLVVTYRDFRDCAASRWRAMTAQFSEYKDERQATRSEAMKVVAEVSVWADRLSKIHHDNAMHIRYENRPEHRVLVEQLAAFVGVQVSDAEVDRIADKWSIENTKVRARQRSGWDDYDVKDQIHGHHVYRGATGEWRRFFPADTHEEITRILEGPLRQWKYLV
jgi:hypothetical protein